MLQTYFLPQFSSKFKVAKCEAEDKLRASAGVTPILTMVSISCPALLHLRPTFMNP